MYFYVTITRNGQVLYVVSPNYGKYDLSAKKEMNTYLWSTAESAEADGRWKHLLQNGDKFQVIRTYSC